MIACRLALVALLGGLAAQPQAAYDIVIRNGRVLDGTGNPWSYADIAVRGGRIAAMGRLSDAAAQRTIDATGLVALESALERLRRARKFVIIAGPLPEPRRIFEKAELEANLDHVLFADDVEQAQEIAVDLVTLNPNWGAALPPVAA